MYNTLKTLCLIPSVSGRETAVSAKLSEIISPYADSVFTDNMGNLIAKKEGKGENKKKIMLCAHMDEIGFLVTYIQDNGFIRVSSVGGISLVAAYAAGVVSEKGVHGIVICESGVKSSDFSADKFIIDIGAKNKKDAERRVKIGDFFVVEPSLRRLTSSRVSGRPLDDRVGCAVLISIAEALSEKELAHDVYYVFSVQEEVGCRGAKPASFAIAPDYALIYDVTGTGDAEGAKPMACSVGKGAAIKIKDSSVICHREVVEMLTEIAKEKKIPYQHEILTYGGTDTSSVQMTGMGCKAGALSIPTRYIHTQNELCDLNDAKACADLTVEFINQLK
ncbi:MAG: M42 family metallopeptidase [Ruminococcaceae bacterium]|nr:M42 family metallopeptidase [Oscillospiraceae bacterium]